ncbi:hypothetical protein AGDE_14155 [Angomonas deanei]|uniref:Vacuolar-sorting-associated 13 protein C-terminal, putative n=1 Tax=Angomonas deanei TaxID=59799 RepID=A0A7G2BYS6_9TRYP|nr:hypothetical protein AGDE_14155 [Angomonas deanei]CAD2212719.1 Vacuolar-sorting-associated 13 protein C-terminal, putative [Angomonas deanei]|eukprot:EPY21334.1 hypothetical protein AGDE_14155 [Angomonas deanei]
MEDENTEVEDVTAKRPHTKFTCPTEEALFFRAPKSMDFMTTRLIVERFIINPILLRLWFFRDDSGADFIRESIKSKEAAVFSMLIGSCDDIKVVTPGIACVKRSNRLSIFTEWLARSYMDGLFAQIKGILLQYASSLPLIGAPVKLFSGISGGAVRLFRDPVDGLTTTNNGFAIGLAKGSSKFAQGFASGSLGAFSNLTDAGARFFSLGTGTSEKQRKSQNTLTAIASGFKGIVQKPREGAAESGTSGFLKGISQGLLGVVTNPISGALNDISHATGTLANMVNDTYVPNTRRLRGIRNFYANGGVAPWKSLISVYEYERGTGKQHDQWDGEHLMSGIDGPQWYPSARDEVTFGNEKKKVPKENWVVNRFDTDFDGWSFSNKYYGRYSPIYTDSVRVRRKRWAALVKPLPHSPIATFLKICPGMSKGEGRISRSASLQFGRTASSSSFQDFTKPGEVMILTATETHLDNQKRKRNHSRTSSQFFTDDDAPTHHHKRSSSWSPGARIGVKHEWARTDVKLEDGDGKCDGTKGVPLLKPCAPAEQMSRSRKKEEKAIRRSQSTSAEQQEYDTEFTNESKRKSKSKPPSRSNSPKPEFFPPLKAYEESGPVLSREESSKGKSKGSRSPRADTKDSKSSGPSPVFVAPPSDQSVEIYEHEKMNKNGSWEKRHLPSNYAVCQFTSGKRAKNRTSIKPPSGYRWMGNWSIVAVDGCDADGWEMVKGEKGIRRRKWKRTLIKK